MTQLMDSLLAALLVSECKDASPLYRFQRAASRVEELLRSTGFPESAAMLQRYRNECGPMPDLVSKDVQTSKPAVVAEPSDDPLLGGKRKREGAGNG